MPKSLLFQNTTDLEVPPGCAAGRQEVVIRIPKGTRIYEFTLRDKLVIEDPYLVLVRGEAFAIRQGEPYCGTVPERAVRDLLIKSNVVI